MEKMTRFRLGCEGRNSRYWEEEEKRRCRLCGEEIETLEHILEKCKITGETGERWKKVLKGDASGLPALYRVTWLRKKIEREEQAAENS